MTVTPVRKSGYRIDAYTGYRGGWVSKFADTADEALAAHAGLKARWEKKVEIVDLGNNSERVRLADLRKRAKDERAAA